MKKILLFSFAVLIIPYIIVSIFIRNDEITFNFSSNSVVRVYREDSGVINVVPIEEYVVGVLAGEMPVDFELEALKAQAVAARSYVMIQMERNAYKDYDVVDSVTNQVYLDSDYLMKVWSNSYTDNINKIKTAVLSTKGEYIAYNGRVAEALFFSTSPGKTENSEDVFPNRVEYLRSVDSSWDAISPVFETKKVFTLITFYNLLSLNYSDDLIISNIDTTITGRIKSMVINGRIFTGNEICSLLGLRSTFFTIEKLDNSVVITNRGYGHGVGMSQYGAEAMAINGYNYQDILKHYYQGIEIKKF